MQHRDQKRKPAPMVFGAGSEIDSLDGQIDNRERNRYSSFNQGQTPLALLPCPVAVARQVDVERLERLLAEQAVAS